MPKVGVRKSVERIPLYEILVQLASNPRPELPTHTKNTKTKNKKEKEKGPMLVLHTQNMVRMETHLLQSKSPLSHICDVSYFIFAGGVPATIALKLFGLRYIKIICIDKAT